MNHRTETRIQGFGIARTSRSARYPSYLSILFALLCFGGCGSPMQTPMRLKSPVVDSTAQVFAQLDLRASGIATWNGRVFVSVPRTPTSTATVFEFVDDTLVPFPSRELQDDIEDSNDLVSVYGLRADSMGRLWMVDNGVIAMSESHPAAVKVVVWDLERNEEAFRRSFATRGESYGPDDAADADDEMSSVEDAWIVPGFLNDVAIDEEQGVAYFTDSGIFSAPAIIVYDFVAEQVLRRLQECPVVAPDAYRTLMLDGGVIEFGPPGERQPWRVGANPIALLPNGDVLTGAMTAGSLFAVSSDALRDPDSANEAACESATKWADRSITDGITADSDGETIWMTNVQDSRVDGYRGGDIVRSFQLPESSFPISIAEYGDDLLVVTNQLHRAPVFHGGDDRGEPPYVIYRIER